MSNKVTITYVDNEYIVKLGETILSKEKDEERAIQVFKNAVKNNTVAKNLSFDDMVKKVKALGIGEVEINENYQSMQCGDMKYFYHTGKAFYTGQGKMVLLLGGFEYFYEMLHLVASGAITSCNELASLCATVIENHATYSLTEEGMSVASAVFSYGNVGFNFMNNKINKGTSSEKSSFKAFKDFILATL